MWSWNLISERALFEKRGTERNPDQGINGFGADVDKKQRTETSYIKKVSLHTLNFFCTVQKGYREEEIQDV